MTDTYNVNFGGFSTATFSFVDQNLFDFFRITMFGEGNTQGLVEVIDVTIRAAAEAPGPIAGAGLPAILALAGFWYLRRRKLANAAP